MSENYSSYPSEIDGYNTLPYRTNLIHEIRAEDVNRAYDALIKIESELGVQPSGSYGTVRDRLDSVADASAHIEGHLADTSDAHDASAISVADSEDYYVGSDVESVLAELAAALPQAPDSIGENSSIPNSGYPDFVAKTGTWFVFNTFAGSNVLKKTQPVNITGMHILEVGAYNGEGTAYLQYSDASPAAIRYRAPGDSDYGTEEDISSLTTGQEVIVSSLTTTKKIRLVRTSASLPIASPLTDTFEIYRPAFVSGSYSLTGTGIKDSNYITRAGMVDGGTSRNQFIIKGIVFPADKGTLVLQRKLRSGSEFLPIATLDLSDNFTETLRSTGQFAYIPTLEDYDTITLFDRLPMKADYSSDTDVDGSEVYSDFDISSSTYSPQQLAKYLIPASNDDISGGTLEAPTDTTATQVNAKVSAYRVVHFKDGVTDFNGDPDSDDIFSVSDTLGGGVSDGDNYVRMSNIYVDTDTTRPTLEQVLLRPIANAEVAEKTISGIHYYNSNEDTFDLEIKSNTNAFANTYKKTGTLRLSSDALTFPSGSTYGTSVDVTELFDDGYTAFGSTNVPVYADIGYYLINASYNSTRRPYPSGGAFSSRAYVSASLVDPFGSGDRFDSYGVDDGQDVRILVNAFDRASANDTTEYFREESYRVGTDETFNFFTEKNQFTHRYGAGGPYGGNPDGYTLDAFDSTIPLTAGELQVGGRFNAADSSYCGLIFPQDNYSTAIRPVQTGAVDYSAVGFQVNSTYQRLFNLGYAVSKFRLRIKSSGLVPLTWDDMDYENNLRCIKVEVKIPGKIDEGGTGFLDISKPLFPGQYVDGDGCLAGMYVENSTGDFTIPLSFGTKNTANSGCLLACRITYIGSRFQIAKEKVITLLQVLDWE